MFILPILADSVEPLSADVDVEELVIPVKVTRLLSLTVTDENDNIDNITVEYLPEGAVEPVIETIKDVSNVFLFFILQFKIAGFLSHRFNGIIRFVTSDTCENTIWSNIWEQEHVGFYERFRSRWACASAQFDQYLHCLYITYTSLLEDF